MIGERKNSPVSDFIRHHYRHFNAAVVVDASEAWIDLAKKGGKMFLAMAGAMSTGELGVSLSELIRRGRIDAISTTGANIEEDVFNLVAHNHYEKIAAYRNLTREQEATLRDRGLNRVTDTCIPEEEAMRKIEAKILTLWREADAGGARLFPYEFFYELIRSEALKKDYQIDPRDSWLVAACEKNIPVYTPGWEDSTLGNVFVANVRKGNIKRYDIVRSGLEQMDHLVAWYLENSRQAAIGFFQIGGGIAGDFPICVVPLIHQDLKQKCPYWSYFCQISDSTTSFGSYSGAVPNEKITWGKLDVTTPQFIIESDASIVAPLIFSYVLGS